MSFLRDCAKLFQLEPDWSDTILTRVAKLFAIYMEIEKTTAKEETVATLLENISLKNAEIYASIINEAIFKKSNFPLFCIISHHRMNAYRTPYKVSLALTVVA